MKTEETFVNTYFWGTESILTERTKLFFITVSLNNESMEVFSHPLVFLKTASSRLFIARFLSIKDTYDKGKAYRDDSKGFGHRC
jgi:hypothetical protein